VETQMEASMQAPGQDIPASRTTYSIGGRRFQIDTPGFAESVANAHASHQRPRCLCLETKDRQGIEMYVARLAGPTGGYIVKRMPATGSQHAPECPSYEPPAELSGLGQVLGSAITEDPVTGETTLKLDFSMSKMTGRATAPGAGTASDSVATDGTKLSLRGLLHYLWDQAELTRWHPGFAGKRTWAAVRKHLLLAAQNKMARGGALHARLYIPEAFSVDQRDAINARRVSHWAQCAHAASTPGNSQPLMLLIAEVKEIMPARYGFKAVIKHVPDQAFAVDEQLYRRLGRRFESELALWGAADDIHMLMIATFAVSAAGIPTIEELSLTPVTQQWLPIEDGFEKQLVEALVLEGRSFVKGLRYNMAAEQLLASAVLTDAGEEPRGLFIPPRVENDESALAAQNVFETHSSPAWVWRTAEGAMPALPDKHRALPKAFTTADT